jgi:hypothetical protein
MAAAPSARPRIAALEPQLVARTAGLKLWRAATGGPYTLLSAAASKADAAMESSRHTMGLASPLVASQLAQKR